MGQFNAERTAKTTSVTDALAIFGLFNLTVARPLFEILARYAEFFVFKRISRFELLAFTLVISILLPGILVLIRFLISKISPGAGRLFQLLLITFFTLVFLLPGFNRQQMIVSNFFMVALVLICVITSLGYFRFHWLRLFYLYLAPAALIVPFLFIASPKIWQLMFSNPVEIPDVSVRSETPVFLIVFDEFPLISLLDEHRNVDAIRYPNFANLTREWNWYRACSTVAERTEESLAGILTGNYPEPDRLPITIQYPKNLFTLFAKSYDLNVFETVTWMNPHEIAFERNHVQLWTSLISDLTLVYLHIILPHKYSIYLPPITQSWGDFASDSEKGKTDRRMNSKDPDVHLQNFLNSIQPTKRPVLHFIHPNVPHFPWYLLPSGKSYGSQTYEGMNLVFAKWLDDEAAVQRAYQRHLMQVGFVDYWIGEFLKKLRKSGLYDQSIIVITADHGISFTSGKTLRTVTQENAEEVIFVPLFIKTPGQKGGRILDWNVETIDILPTIAELAGVEIPWKMDGISVASSPPPKDRTRIVCSENCKIRNRFDANFKSDNLALHRKLRWFGSGQQIENLNSPCREIIGKRVEAETQSVDGFSAKMRNQTLFANVNLQTNFLPVFVAGRIHGNDLPAKKIVLAVSVNGIYRATTLSAPLDSTTHHFDTLIPEISLSAGKNDVGIYFLPTCSERPQLIRQQ